MNIPVWLPAILLVLGVVGLVFKNQFSNMLGKVGSPFGLKVNTTLIILSVVAIALGGFTTISSFASNGFHLGTASLSESSNVADAGVATSADITCRYVSAPQETAPLTQNITFRSDPKDLTNYYADVKFDNGASSINGTLFCESARPNIRQGVKSTCYVKSDTFRSETSTTDSNVYDILASSTVASVVPGKTWQETAYIADSGTTNTGATTSSALEKTDLVFAQDETQQYIGFYVTLPGTTVFGYLNNQTAQGVHIICNGKEVGKLTVTKTTS